MARNQLHQLIALARQIHPGLPMEERLSLAAQFDAVLVAHDFLKHLIDKSSLAWSLDADEREDIASKVRYALLQRIRGGKPFETICITYLNITIRNELYRWIKLRSTSPRCVEEEELAQAADSVVSQEFYTGKRPPTSTESIFGGRRCRRSWRLLRQVSPVYFGSAERRGIFYQKLQDVPTEKIHHRLQRRSGWSGNSTERNRIDQLFHRQRLALGSEERLFEELKEVLDVD